MALRDAAIDEERYIGCAKCVNACAGGALQLVSGRSLVIACPKPDNKADYLEKLTDLFRHSGPASVTIARMEVLCCSGSTNMVLAARDAAQGDLPLTEVIIGLGGDTISANQHLSVPKEIPVRN